MIWKNVSDSLNKRIPFEVRPAVPGGGFTGPMLHICMRGKKRMQ